MGNLPEKEFKVVIVKMIKELGRRMDAQSENLEVFNNELESIKNGQTKMKNTITEMKNTLKGINCRLNDKEEQINDLEDRVAEITDAEQKKEKKEINTLRHSVSKMAKIKDRILKAASFPFPFSTTHHI